MGLHIFSIWFFRVLEHEPGMTAAELGKALTLDKATLSGVIDRLADGGWIIKKGDPETIGFSGCTIRIKPMRSRKSSRRRPSIWMPRS